MYRKILKSKFVIHFSSKQHFVLLNKQSYIQITTFYFSIFFYQKSLLVFSVNNHIYNNKQLKQPIEFNILQATERSKFNTLYKKFFLLECLNHGKNHYQALIFLSVYLDAISMMGGRRNIILMPNKMLVFSKRRAVQMCAFWFLSLEKLKRIN